MQTKYYLLISAVLLCGCKEIIDKEFTIKCIPYLGSELRIDGYYSKEHLSRIRFMVFYSNGVILQSSAADVYELEAVFQNTPSSYRNNRLLWGPFVINGNQLRFEQYNNIWADLKWRISTVYCTILNDTTFRIDNARLSYTGEDVTNSGGVLTGEYHFRQFYPKPDSTNNVVP